MRRTPKSVIYNVADTLLIKRGIITQYDVHKEIERKLKMNLTKYEKVRITLLLRNRYSVVRISRKKENGSRVMYFR